MTTSKKARDHWPLATHFNLYAAVMCWQYGNSQPITALFAATLTPRGVSVQNKSRNCQKAYWNKWASGTIKFTFVPCGNTSGGFMAADNSGFCAAINLSDILSFLALCIVLPFYLTSKLWKSNLFEIISDTGIKVFKLTFVIYIFVLFFKRSVHTFMFYVSRNEKSKFSTY